MITAVFTSGFDHTEVSGLWQYDYGQKLRIQGLSLPPAVEIQFSLNKSGGDSESRVGITKDGVTDVTIPDSMLENGGSVQNYYIYAFIYITDETSGKTVKWVQLHVNSRPKPEAFDSPEEAKLFREAIAAVNDSADRAETAQRAVEEAKEQVAKDKEEVFLAKNAVKESEKNVTENKEYVRQAVDNFTSLAENAVDNVNVAGQNQVNNIEKAGQAALDNISTGVDETLTQSGKAADAEATGKAIDELKSDLGELDERTDVGNIESDIPLNWETGSRFIMRTEDIGKSLASSSSIPWYNKASVIVSEGDKYKVSLSLDRTDTAHIGFANDSMELLYFVTESIGPDRYEQFEITIPNDCTKLVLNSKVINNNVWLKRVNKVYVKDYVDSKTAAIANDIAFVENSINTLNQKVDSFIGTGSSYYSKETYQDRPVSEFNLAPLVNGIPIKTQIKENETILTNTNTYSHAPCIRIINGKAYVLSIEDSVEQKEAGMYTHPNLAVFPVNNLTNIDNYSVGITGDNVGNEKLYNAGSCVGLEKDDDDNLHCVWYSRLESK